MSNDVVRIRGKLYVRLEDVAHVYRVEQAWLLDVYERGMLGSGEPVGTSIAIAAVQLDRVATIVRLHEVLELDLDTIEVQLPDDD